MPDNILTEGILADFKLKEEKNPNFERHFN
jgi:hypothetical protein